MVSVTKRIKGIFGSSEPVKPPASPSNGTVIQPDSALFTANPKDFILANPCNLVDGYAQGADAFNVKSMGGRTKHFISKEEHRITAKLVNDPRFPTCKNIKAMPSSTPWEREFYYLPWGHDICAFGNIKSSVEFLLTGPLTGCNVYLAIVSGQPVLFHANANEGEKKGDIAANVADKDADVQKVLHSLGGGKVVGRVVRGQYDKDATSFVWGHKEGGQWRLYIHCASPDGSSFTNTRFYPPTERRLGR